MIIFSPGPSNISERVRRALLAPDICHRDEEFTSLLAGIRARILDVAGVDRQNGYATVVFTGSGSTGIESTVAAARPLGRMLVVSNGPYGQRAAAMARYHGVDVDEMRLEWDAAIDVDAVAARLEQTGARSLYVVHHETATGRVNPLAALAAAGKGRGCHVLVDAVSSIAGEELDIPGWELDAVIGSANKCIRGVPGAAFVVASRAFVDAAQRQRGAHATNFAEHLAAEERGETPFTPAVQVFQAFHEALGETLAEGVPTRITHFRRLRELLQRRLPSLGIRFLLPAEAYGNTLVSCALPDGWSYVDLHRTLKRDGYVIYAAQGAYRERAFRLGLVGHFGVPEVEGFLDALERVLTHRS